MAFPRGLSVRGDVAICMVVGCERKAIYRRSSQSKHGYCAVHKSMIAPANTSEAVGYVEYVEALEDVAWEIHVDEKDK